MCWCSMAGRCAFFIYLKRDVKKRIKLTWFSIVKREKPIRSAQKIKEVAEKYKTRRKGIREG